VAEAGGTVAGGHTIRSEEPIFGLAVQGLVHPDRVWTKAGARPGDVLLLSKPIGTGILLAGGEGDDKAMAIANMRRLNRWAAEALSASADAPHAVTDVTGFGLFGHAWEMAERSGARLVLDADALPFYPGARATAARGVRTGGDARNRTYLDGRVEVGSGVAPEIEALCFDPQTSGGLLAAVAPGAADDPALADAGFVPIGTVEAGTPGVALR
jgi:selenide,water dikinase